MDNNYQYQQNNYYQNIYNMFGGNNPVIDKEASEIRRLGTNAGTACLGFIILQYAFILALRVSGLAKLYTSNVIFEYGLGLLGQVLYIFVPFFILYLASSQEEKNAIMKFDKPNSKTLYVFAVCIGLGACLFSNVFSNILLGLFSFAGVDFMSGMEDSPVADGPLGYLITILSVAVISPLLEEFAFRGVLLQPLRKYGDKFAIVTSSLIFGVMHGNMVQAPAAFAVGMLMAYFCIKTNSIWTSVTIHILNNLLSCILSFFYEKNPDASGVIPTIIMGAFVAIGAAAIPFYFKADKAKLSKGNSSIEHKQKRCIFLCVPTVLLSIIHCIYMTITLQNTTSFFGKLVLSALLIVFAVFVSKGVKSVQNDKRITPSKVYGFSKVMVIVATVFNIILLLASSLQTNITVN